MKIKPQELRKLDHNGLVKRLKELELELLKVSNSQSSSNKKKTNIRDLKKNIARVKTIINELSLKNQDTSKKQKQTGGKKNK